MTRPRPTGRPSRTGRPATKRITVWLDPDEYADVAARAKRLGVAVSAFVRVAAIKEARKK